MLARRGELAGRPIHHGNGCATSNDLMFDGRGIRVEFALDLMLELMQ